MKSNLKNIGLLAFATILFASCTKNEAPTLIPPSGAAYKGITENGLKKNTQNFSATAGAGLITLTSTKGVVITLNGSALTKNGNPVTGAIDITFVELFDKGNMLISNKPTMGVMPNGKKKITEIWRRIFHQSHSGWSRFSVNRNNSTSSSCKFNRNNGYWNAFLGWRHNRP